jgi:site-specific recombinase XerD
MTLSACVPQRPGSAGELSAARLRALIVVLWRTGMRMTEMLALEERDLHRAEKMIVIRRGKGGKRRLVMMDEWGWDQLERVWLPQRAELKPGQLFCVLNGRTAGRAMHDSDVRRQVALAGRQGGVRRRVHAHVFRHTHACELLREGLSIFAIQQQLGHANLAVTEAYLRGIAVTEVLAPIGQRRAPMMLVPDR